MPLDWDLINLWSGELVDLVDDNWMHAGQIANLLSLRGDPGLSGFVQNCLHVDRKSDCLISELFSNK